MTGQMTIVEEPRQTFVDAYHDLEQRYQEFRDQTYLANRRAMRVIEDHPVACVIGALTAGYVVGKLAKARWLI